jgi:hypothetical protein
MSLIALPFPTLKTSEFAGYNTAYQVKHQQSQVSTKQRPNIYKSKTPPLQKQDPTTTKPRPHHNKTKIPSFVDTPAKPEAADSKFSFLFGKFASPTLPSRAPILTGYV